MQCAFANVKINSTKEETQPLYEEAVDLLNNFEEIVTELEQPLNHFWYVITFWIVHTYMPAGVNKAVIRRTSRYHAK